MSSYIVTKSPASPRDARPDIVVDGVRVTESQIHFKSRAISLCNIHSVRSDGLHLLISYFPPPTRKQTKVSFETSSAENAVSLVDSIHERVTIRRSHLLILINPFGGKKQAEKLFATQVEPLLKSCTTNIISYEVIRTQCAGHAVKIAAGIALSKYSAVVSVSGDGLLYEIIQGLMKRSDWSSAIKTPIAIIPGGSGNALASALGCFDCKTAAALICCGMCRPLDLLKVTQGPYTMYSFLMQAWGIVADVDFESEKYRWMGGARFTVAAIQRIASLRLYSGRVSYIPDTHWDMEGSQPCLDGKCKRCAYQDPQAQALASAGTPAANLRQSLAAQPEKPHNINSPRNPDDKFDDFRTERLPEGPPTPHLDSDESSEHWVHKDADDWVMVTSGNVTHLSYDMKSHPHAHLSDGCLDLILVRRMPKPTLLKLFLGIEKGEHVHVEGVEYLKVKALKISPSKEQQGFMDLDGELAPLYDSMSVEPIRGLANIITFQE